MRCPQCAHESSQTARFCEECGARLMRACPHCGRQASPGAKFCPECGHGLHDAPKGIAPQSVPERDAPAQQLRAAAELRDNSVTDGERKTITALFADIKGSMELIEDLDPEEARAIVDPALRLMMEAVHRYEGFVAQSTGDGIFALFGAPVAHEDHPQRALYAALRMQEEIRRYSDRLRTEGRQPLQARVGVNTGEVVMRSVSTGEHAEYVPVGHATSLAARMQVLAPIGSIAITATTQRLVEGYFALKALGPTKVKGVSEPINVFEVTGLGPLRTRLQRSAGRGLSKFVGRQAEMESLKRAAEQAKAGHGQIVAAMAEAGVGKSRLFYEFKATSLSGCLILEAYSLSHGRGSPYLPVIELLKSYFEIGSGDDERKRREKIGGKLLMLDGALGNALPYVFALLGTSGDDDLLVQMDAQIRKRGTLEAIKRLLLRESLNQPLIVVFEDLHWADNETQALLDLLADSLGNARVLLLVSYRPEYSHQWGSKTYYTQLRLDPLEKNNAAEMLDGLLGEAKDLAPLKRLVIEKTEGNPFFMEEMVQALFEQGALIRNGSVKPAKPLNSVQIPLTVQAVLASRIDRLPADQKELLQMLAVIGTEFPATLVTEVTGKSAEELARMLLSLQLAEFIYEQPALPEVEYTFKHALTHDVAYNSVLIERRKALHERTAEFIESLFTATLDDHLAELAHHYARGGNSRKAVEYLGRAGEQAAQRSSHPEAIRYFTAALEALATLSPDSELAQEELSLQTSLGRSLIVVKGQAAADVGRAFTRARDLCARVGNQAQLFSSLLGLWFHSIARLELKATLEFAKQLVRVAETVREPGMLIAAYRFRGQTLLWLGEFRSAAEDLESALNVPDLKPTPTTSYVADPRTATLSYQSLALWCLGYPDRALRASEQSLAGTQQQSKSYSLAIALYYAAQLYRLLRNFRLAQERAATAITIAVELGFSYLLGRATLERSCAAAHQGQVEQGMADMDRGIATIEFTEAEVSGMFCTPLAECCLEAKQVSKGLAATERGLSVAERTGERLFEAELFRLRGELLLEKTPANTSAAERAFAAAIETARRQGAKSFELRATTSLARLLASDGRRKEAHEMLAAIYSWFTEGLDTPDLIGAKALLDELASDIET